MGGAILLDMLDARFRYAADVSRDIGLDILGSIPRIESGKGKRGVMNAAQALEAFRELRIHVGFAYGSAGPITLTITSPSEGEGKSLIASNLAVAFSEVGRRTLLVDWNQTQRVFPTDACMHQLFEAQAERTPEAIALIDGHREWTYRELNEQANRLAHYLRTLGVVPESKVGVCMGRSPDMVIGLLAILLAVVLGVPLGVLGAVRRDSWAQPTSG